MLICQIMVNLYLLNLMREIIVASLHVIRLILSPARKPEPVLIEFDSGLPTEFQNVVLANSITLTPGTITLDIAEEDGKDYYYIHWIDVTAPSGKEEARAKFCKEWLEKQGAKGAFSSFSLQESKPQYPQSNPKTLTLLPIRITA